MNELGNSDKLARLLGIIGPDYDYSKTSGIDSRGHSTDLGKLPWHPTFSQESAYSSPEFIGGVWNQNGNYTPSLDMINAGFTHGLGRYMRRVEPNSKLLVTPPLSKKAFEKAIK